MVTPPPRYEMKCNDRTVTNEQCKTVYEPETYEYPVKECQAGTENKCYEYEVPEQTVVRGHIASIYIKHFVSLSISQSFCHVLFVPRGQTICLSPGGQTFLTHRREGDKHFSHTGRRG